MPVDKRNQPPQTQTLLEYLGVTELAKKGMNNLKGRMWYIGLLGLAVGVNTSYAAHHIFNKYAYLVELQRVMTATEQSFWVPATLGLAAGSLTLVGKTISVAFDKKKNKKNMDPEQVEDPERRKFITGIGIALLLGLVAPKLTKLVTKEALLLLTNLQARPDENGVREYPQEFDLETSKILIQEIEKIYGSSLSPKEKILITNQILPKNHPHETYYLAFVSSLVGYLRFAEFYSRDIHNKEKGAHLLDNYEFFREKFLTPLLENAKKAGISPVTLNALIGFSGRLLASPEEKDLGMFSRSMETSSEQKRLIYGAAHSIADHEISTAARAMETAAFLAFPVRDGPYDGPLGPFTALRMTKESSIGVHDTEITPIGESILALINHPNFKDSEMVSKLMQDYPETIEVAIRLRKSWEDFEKQRTVTRFAIDAYTKVLSDSDPINDLFKDTQNNLWGKFGMDAGLNSSLIPDIMNIGFQTTHQTRVWKNYVKLDRLITPPEEIVSESFTKAREYFVNLYKTNRKEAVRQLIVDQFENPKFWEFMLSLPENHKKEVKKIIKESEILKQFGRIKRDRVAEAYGEFAQHENDYFWQIASSTGLGIYFINKINEMPFLKKLAEAEPLWQMFATMFIREIMPDECIVNPINYPSLTDVDIPTFAPLQKPDSLEHLEKLAIKLNDVLPHLNPQTLLDLVLEVLNSHNVFGEVFYTKKLVRAFKSIDKSGKNEELDKFFENNKNTIDTLYDGISPGLRIAHGQYLQAINRL